jgi:hypothetical protein
MRVNKFLAAAAIVLILASCSRTKSMDEPAELRNFAQRYADAWCSHDPEKVAAFYSKGASIAVNGGAPTSIIEVARGFMRDFPDIVVTFDKVESTPNGIEFHWTFTGTNTGPSGTGNKVRISGYEV